MSSEKITTTLFPSKPAKDQMPDWAAIYDPRYCGPSREAYIEEMTREYRRGNTDANIRIRCRPTA